MLIKQLIYLRKVKNENLKLRTDLRDRAMDGWSVIKQMIILSSRLLKKSLNLKLKLVQSMQVSTCQYMAFKQGISFAIILTVNFGFNRFWIMPEIISKILRTAIWRCCTLWLESGQTPFTRTGRRLRPASLRRIRFGSFGFVQKMVKKMSPLVRRKFWILSWFDFRRGLGVGWDCLVHYFFSL